MPGTFRMIPLGKALCLGEPISPYLLSGKKLFSLTPELFTAHANCIVNFNGSTVLHSLAKQFAERWECLRIRRFATDRQDLHFSLCLRESAYAQRICIWAISLLGETLGWLSHLCRKPRQQFFTIYTKIHPTKVSS